MPYFPIIDTHVHVWNPALLRYPWLDAVPLLNKSFLLKDYQAETKEVEIEKMVFVQCECEFAQCEDEVAWVSQLAEKDNRLQGIVAWAPLELGAGAAPVLDRYSVNPLVKGIRRIIQFEQDTYFCLRKEFIEGVRLLSDYQFTFDLCVVHHQLEKVVTLVEACPEVNFVLDHIGKPDIKNYQLIPWKSTLLELSKFDNVQCKMSGLLTEADHVNWKTDEICRYINYVVECFTPDKIMFGGDWPVLTQAATFLQWIHTLDIALAGLSHGELMKIYKSNAEQFYRLN